MKTRMSTVKWVIIILMAICGLLLVSMLTGCKKEEQVKPEPVLSECEILRSNLHISLANQYVMYLDQGNWNTFYSVWWASYWQPYTDVLLDAGCDTTGWRHEAEQILIDHH